MNIADAHNYLEVFWYQSFTNETAVEWIFFSAMIANSSLTLTLGKDVCRYGRNIGFLFLQHRGRPTPINLCKTWWKYISRHFKTNSMVKFYTCNALLRSKLSKYRIMPYVINMSNFVFYILVLIILQCTCLQKTKKNIDIKNPTCQSWWAAKYIILRLLQESKICNLSKNDHVSPMIIF